MRKKRKVIISGLVLLFLVTLKFLPKSKMNRKVREEFKSEFLTYQTNVDFASIELKDNLSLFFDIDVLELNNNILYFDGVLNDFAENLEDSLYEYENINEDIII